MLIALRTSKIRENRFLKISSNTHLMEHTGIFVICMYIYIKSKFRNLL